MKIGKCVKKVSDSLCDKQIHINTKSSPFKKIFAIFTPYDALKQEDVFINGKYYDAQLKTLTMFLLDKMELEKVILVGNKSGLQFENIVTDNVEYAYLPNIKGNILRILFFNIFSLIFLLNLCIRYGRHRIVIYAYSEGIVSPYLSIAILSRLNKIFFFVDFRNPPSCYISYYPINRIKKVLELISCRIVCNISGCVIHISKKSMVLIKDQSITKKSIIIPSCPDKNFFIKDIERKESKDKIIFCYWGTLSKKRRLEDVVLGFIRACENDTMFALKAEFIVIGEGEDYDNIVRISNDSKFNNIYICKYMSTKDLVEKLKEIDVAVISIPEVDFYQYSSPLKLSEAIAAGLPILASNIQPSSIVRQYKLGVTTVSDVNGYCLGFLKFLENDKLALFKRNVKYIRHTVLQDNIFKELIPILAKI